MTKPLLVLSILLGALTALPSTSHAAVFSAKVIGARAYPSGAVMVLLSEPSRGLDCHVDGASGGEGDVRILVKAAAGLKTESILSVALAAQLSGRRVRFEKTGSHDECVASWLELSNP